MYDFCMRGGANTVPSAEWFKARSIAHAKSIASRRCFQKGGRWRLVNGCTLGKGTKGNYYLFLLVPTELRDRL